MTGAGVDAQAPGGRGVFVNVSDAPLKRSGVATVRSVSVSSSEEEGGPGRSGSPCGGEGVWNSRRELEKDGRFVGVDSKPKIVVGVGGVGSGSVGATMISGGDGEGGEGGGEGGGATLRAFWNTSSSLWATE